MTTYKPYGIKELQDVLQEAREKDLPVLSRHQKQDGIGLDFQNWNMIREIDPVNLTVTAERGVTFGELEEAVRGHGLHMAAMTEDLRDITLGDFFAEQYGSLTGELYNQPRYQVLGLEVMLADGTILHVAGKTVKNVTGYDMCRFYISSRETLAIPLAFTIKLVSRKAVQAVLEAPVETPDVLPGLVRSLREKHLRPEVCVYWNRAAAKAVSEAGGRLVMVLSGTQERVQRDLWEISKTAEALGIALTISEQPEVQWEAIRKLREKTIWHDGVKVPTLQCEAMLEALEEYGIGCWYGPLQGSLQLMPPVADGGLYGNICKAAEELGGCGNWYYQYLYGFAPAGETRVWQQLKDKFDAEGRLNPINRVEKGGEPHGN